MSAKEVEIKCPQCNVIAKKAANRVAENNKHGIKTYCSRECWRISQMSKRGPAKERFFSRINKTDNGCWLWTANKTFNGYGRLNINGSAVAAHRYSYLIHHGEIPIGYFVCHKCDTPSCVNPDHLFVGTAKDNFDDMVSKSRNEYFSAGLRVMQRGVANNNCKLSPETVLQMRESWGKTCTSYGALVKAFGLKSKGHARKIIIRELWSHI